MGGRMLNISANIRFLGLIAILSCNLMITTVACATTQHRTVIKDGQTLQELTLQDVAAAASPGMVLIVGETHDNPVHSSQHILLLEALKARGLKVSIGMEFLTYTDQAYVDLFLQQQLDEPSFLKAVNWRGNNFQFYRDQILFSRSSAGRTYALNAPRSLSSKISKSGLPSLTPEESALLPPQFTRGNQDYFDRFKAAMGSHVPGPEALERYFMAQSLWDDTMAWRAQLALQSDPGQVLVIIVGEFHAQYGGGLADRLRARGIHSIQTVSQINIRGLSPSEVQVELQPHSQYGPRADYLWVADF